MFQISPDQTQWFHLYRVQKLAPITFVLFTCEEVNDYGNSSRWLDLRILSGNRETLGGSWCLRASGDHGKPVNRAECTKFLELRAKFTLANTIGRGIDEIELLESSREELQLAIAVDEGLHTKLEAIAPSVFPRIAREMIAKLAANETNLEVEELPDWPTRNVDLLRQQQQAAFDAEAAEAAIRAQAVEPLTKKTQKVPI